MFRLRVEDGFAAAHQLRGYLGKCENLHGHNWRVRILASGERLDEIGMLMDFGELKALLRQSLAGLDHSLLNETAPFDLINPTSENLARHLFSVIQAGLPDGVNLDKVTVWESDGCAATYGS